MPLPKPNKGDPLNSADFRQSSAYSEANTPRPGLGVRVRRTVGGSSISVSPTSALAQSGDSSGSSSGIPFGTEVVVDVIWDTTGTTPKFMLMKAKWDGTAFVNNAAATEITTLTTHEAAHGVT